MSKILLSIPCLFGVEHTRECIESIAFKKDIDVHLIDNGAEESVKNLLADYERRCPNVKVVHNEHNTFVNPAINQGMKHFLDNKEYEYFISINSDLILYNN